MNSIRNNYLMNCPNCAKKFSEGNLPKIFPCGKTICQECEKILLQYDRTDKSTSFRCKLCDSEHHIPRINSFPINEILLDFIVSLSNQKKSNLKSQIDPNLKMNLAMNQLEVNTQKLEKRVESLNAGLTEHFAKIRQKIMSRTEQIVNEIYESRNEMISDLELRQKVTTTHINQSRGKIETVQKECHKDFKRYRVLSINQFSGYHFLVTIFWLYNFNIDAFLIFSLRITH